MKTTSLLLTSALVLCTAASAFCAGQEMPASHPKIELPAQSTTHQKTSPLSGKVLQSMNSGGYSYINIQKKDGEKMWVAVKETKVVTGEQMSFMEGLVMSNFESKTLKRTFDKIVFSDGVIQPGKTEAAKTETSKTAPKDLSVPTMPVGGNPAKPQKVELGSKSAVAAKEKVSVTKAKGADAYTVEEVYKKSATLDKKQVVIRGKVVKASTGIMKRTWVHIQDGTGSQSKGTHNLVCTTKSTVSVGDVVTVKGVLAKNRDFGSGYRYNVIIEDAAITKQ